MMLYAFDDAVAVADVVVDLLNERMQHAMVRDEGRRGSLHDLTRNQCW
jgi:hypothetical protein